MEYDNVSYRGIYRTGVPSTSYKGLVSKQGEPGDVYKLITEYCRCN